ncbi:MAG: multidrug ABC transporter permease [Isosphaeraceae bacterium]|jgi:putative ABC transport system permease protein|nr:MAG: multidrug ABC transporter permease [Isosphaeraceae bacterium]
MALVPLRYNLRNLAVRWPTTLLTVLVVAIVVACTCVLFGLVDGLEHSNAISGDPQTLVVLGKRADNETSSYFDVDKAQTIATLDGIATGPPRTDAQAAAGWPDVEGRPLAAGEIVHIPIMTRTDGSRVNLTIRGVDAASPYLRPDFQIVAGRYLRPGTRECILSPGMSRRFTGAQLGSELVVTDKETYRVVGLFTAGGSVAESEVWTGRDDVAAATNRTGSVSSMRIRAASPDAAVALIDTLSNDNRFVLKPIRESKYYADQNLTALFLTFLGSLIAVLLTIGALFAAANTMFAAVKSRTREIGTLRALGFSRPAILFSFLLEAILITTLGGLLGALLSLIASRWSFGISDFNTFTERMIQIRIGLVPLAVAIAMTLAMGIFGGLFPAIRAVRLDVIKALREL